MKIDIDVPLKMKGIVTIEAHTPQGELLHQEVQDNIIVVSGFYGLRNTRLGDQLLNTCILGRDGQAPTTGDAFYQGPGEHGFINEYTDVVCPKEFAGDSYCPVPQDRSIVARSTANGGTDDVYAYTGDPDYYWSLTRKRIFAYDTDYFLAATAVYLADAGCPGGNQLGSWTAEGWGDLTKEASYIKEIGFCSGDVDVHKANENCGDDNFTVPYWAAESDLSGILWNRVVLDQSIGFESVSPWDTPDVVLASDAIITVTIELRVYFDTTANTQVMDINGVETTVRTRVGTAGYFDEALLRRLGYWRGDTYAGWIGESNTLPSITGYYNSNHRISSASTIEATTYAKARKYKISSGLGNYGGGIGGIIHGNFVSGFEDRHLFCTVFNPKIVKTELERVEFNMSKPKQIAHIGIQGIVKSVELINVKTGKVTLKLGPFPNLIVDAAMNAIGSSGADTDIDSLVEYLGVGTDNTAPANGQTALGSQVDDRYNDADGFSDTYASGDGYAYWEATRTRVIGTANGNGNLTELGFFKEASGGTMWSRALFLDGEGAPTTVVKTDEEQLRVVYAWRVYLVLSPTTDVITINAVEIDCDSRALKGNEADAWGGSGYLLHLGKWNTDYRMAKAYLTNTFPAIDGGIFTGDSDQPDSISLVAYGAGNFYRDMDIIFEPGDANFDGGVIGAIALPWTGTLVDGDYALGTTFDPKVAKSNLERFTFRARVSWGRH